MTTLTIVEIVGREFAFYTPYLGKVKLESTRKEFSEGIGEEYKVISGDTAFVFRLRPSKDKMKVDVAHQIMDYRRSTWTGRRVSPRWYQDIHYLKDSADINIYLLLSGETKVRVWEIPKEQSKQLQEDNYQNQQTF